MRARPPWLLRIEIERPCKKQRVGVPWARCHDDGAFDRVEERFKWEWQRIRKLGGETEIRFFFFLIALMHWPRDLDTGVASGEAGSSGGDDRGLEAHHKYTKHPCIVVTFCEMNAAN